MKSAAVILAAGSSSRMGQSKQTLDIHGEKLLIRTIQTVMRAGVSRVIIVLGSEEKAHRDLIKELRVDIIHNTGWQRGMGSSLKAGLRQLISNDPSTEVVVVSVCDQPLLSPENIQALINRYKETGKAVIASEYSGAPGVPALFHKSYFERLMRLPDDQGAKKIILENIGETSLVPFPGGEVDLDTMEDYRSYLDTAGDPP